jgi:beta-lactamase regulating signal transducer with metallopeptidase domain
MLDKMFLQVLNMSYTAGIVILFVLALRLLLKNAPKKFSYALWGAVLFRLICPYSFESIFSLLPAKAVPIAGDIVYMPAPGTDSGVAINNAVQAVLPATAPASFPAVAPYAGVDPLQLWIFFGKTVWLLGMAILLVCSIVSLLRLHKQLSKAVHKKDNIYLAEGLETAFVMGLFRPRIYLPATLSIEEKKYILLHEETHIKRFDHVTRIFSFFVLCLHWFNPLVWLAFYLSNKDMEMSCDEAVIKKMGNELKKEYSLSLLSLAIGKRIVGGIPLAFGEGDTRGRIKNVLNFKKPAFWVMAVTMIAVIIMGIGLTANPINSIRLPDANDVNFSTEMLDRVVYGTLIVGDKIVEFSQVKAPEFVDFVKELRVSKKEISKNRDEGRDSTNQIHLAYEGFGNDGTTYNLYFNFSTDFTEIWLDNSIKPGFSYRVKKPKEVQEFFERQLGSVMQIVEIGSAEELWESRTKYIGDNSAVGRLLGLMPLPEDLRHNSFKLQTGGAERGLEWILDEAENAAYQASQFDRTALLLFALVNNMEDFYVTTKDPFGGGTKLHYDRAWANKEAGGDIRDYAQSPETLQELLDLISLKEIDPNIPKLTITTPRDEFSPFMSSMFGFELVVNAPGDPAKFTYACARGSFCTYKDAKITYKGNNLTTAEKVYWSPLEGDEYVYSGKTGRILISVTALDKDGKVTAHGTAVIESSPEGGWFKFIGEAAAGGTFTGAEGNAGQEWLPQPEIEDHDQYLKALEEAQQSIKTEDISVGDSVGDLGSNEGIAQAWMEAWFAMFKVLPENNMARIADGVIDSLEIKKISKEGLPKAFVFSVTLSVRPTYPIAHNAFWAAGNTGNSPGRDETWGQMYREVELRLEDDGWYHFVSMGTGGVGNSTAYDFIE